VNVCRFLCCVLLFVLQAQGQIVDSLALYGTALDVDVYGNLFVIDAETNLLTVYSPGERKKVRQFGGQGWGNEQFDAPRALWARNGLDIFVADYGNHRIQRYDRTLSYVSTLYTRDNADPAKRFGYPTDVALTRLGDLFVCDSENARILKLTRSTQADRTFGGLEAGKGRLFSPAQIEAGPEDYLYVLDRERVVVFDTFGNFMHELGAGLFEKPHAVYADPDRVMVLDGDLLFRFDDRERPMEPILVSSITSGRFDGDRIRSMVYTGSRLVALTPEGLFVIQLPPAEGVRGQPGQ